VATRRREELQTTVMKPRRTDIDIKQLTLLWVPRAQDTWGI